MAKPRRWNIQEENFVIKQYLKEPQPSNITVKRAFRLKFYPKNPRALSKVRPANFRRIFDRFERNGTHQFHKASGMPKRTPNQEVAENVESYIEENPTSTLREAEKQLNVPKTTVTKYLYNPSKFKIFFRLM